MAKVRIGFSTQFELENELVGIGTDNPTNTLQALGNIQSSDAKAIGVSTFTTYQGFVDTKAAISGAGGAKSGATSGEIIIEGTVNVSSGTTFTSGPENLTTTDDFTLPGISDDKASVGTTRFNENLASLEFYTGVEWRAVNSYVDMGNRNRGRGINQGGNPSGNVTEKTIDYIEIASLGNTVAFGELTAAVYGGAAMSSSTRGLCCGGYAAPGGHQMNIDYITLASTGNATDFGADSTAGWGAMGTSSSTRGVSGGGGLPAGLNTIEYFIFSTLGSKTDFGDLSTVWRGKGTTGLNSPTRSIWCGGYQHPQGVSQSTMEFANTASTGNASDFGDMIAALRFVNGASSPTRGIIGGGDAYPSYDYQSMQSVTIASTGSAQYFGDLINAAHARKGATSNNTRAVFSGGVYPGGYTKQIEYVNFATSGNSNDFGDMTFARAQTSSVSDSHGGLGGF